MIRPELRNPEVTRGVPLQRTLGGLRVRDHTGSRALRNEVRNARLNEAEAADATRAGFDGVIF
jgi:hypothetical protein